MAVLKDLWLTFRCPETFTSIRLVHDNEDGPHGPVPNVLNSHSFMSTALQTDWFRRYRRFNPKSLNLQYE